MEVLKNEAKKVASCTKLFFQEFFPLNSIKDVVYSAARGEMFALVVNELNIKDLGKYQGCCILFVFLLAVLLFCVVYKASVGTFKVIKSTAKMSIEFISAFLCIAILANIIK